MFRVVRPDGSVIECEPGSFFEDALWKAREHDERLFRLVRRNRTNNVSGSKRAGYTFLEVTDAPVL